MNHPSLLAQQVDAIVDDKIARISRQAWREANILPNGQQRKTHKPYTLPAIVGTLVAMRAECANPSTSRDRLEGIASFATTGESRELAFRA